MSIGHHGEAIDNFGIFCYLVALPYIICSWQMSCSQKIRFLWWNLDEVRHPQSWRVTWGYFRKFPNKQFQFHGCELDYNIFLLWIFEGNWTTFARSYWHMSRAFIKGPTCETSSQNKQFQSKRRSDMLGVWGFCICYFGAHGSGHHHPTPVDTFQPSRSPPSGLQTHQNIRWWPILGCMKIEVLGD